MEVRLARQWTEEEVVVVEEEVVEEEVEVEGDDDGCEKDGNFKPKIHSALLIFVKVYETILPFVYSHGFASI